MKLVAKPTRRPSFSEIVSRAPTVGPSIVYIPPTMAAKMICSETAMPETVSGLRYIRYCPRIAPPSAVSAALITATRSFSRMTLMPLAAAASSSSEIASSASRPMPRSIAHHSTSPPSHSTSEIA